MKTTDRIQIPVIEQEEFDFLKLARKFARHYHEDDLTFQPYDCMICESIREIDMGQMAVAQMLDGRDSQGTEDADDLRTVRPF